MRPRTCTSGSRILGRSKPSTCSRRPTGLGWADTRFLGRGLKSGTAGQDAMRGQRRVSEGFLGQEDRGGGGIGENPPTSRTTSMTPCHIGFTEAPTTNHPIDPTGAQSIEGDVSDRHESEPQVDMPTPMIPT